MRLTTTSQTCPHCNANLIHSEIPKDSRHCYLPISLAHFDDGRFLFYSRVIGLSSLIFDRCLAYQCPDCKAIDVIAGCESMWTEETGGVRE